jgi:2-polyprenyl-3-methyl-5-hydroxy-6-metoxy-1,4-benzoquinol methylase
MNQSAILDDIIARIEEKNPMHAKKLRKNVGQYDDEYYARADKFFSKYVELLGKSGRTIEYGIDCYLKMNADMMYEQINFAQTGEYSCKSFKDALEKVYSNPAIMEYYMHGLVVSQFLWKHHYAMFNFFLKAVAPYMGRVKSYLEIGAGHGLFIAEAIEILKDCRRFDVVDISESSIELAQKFIASDRVKYFLTDIYEFDPAERYDFISMGEVMEHVEDPVKLLTKVRSLLNADGRLFITVPANSPVMDHIYLFRNADEIREVVGRGGFEVCDELGVYVEDVPKEKAERLRVTLMYGALLKTKR